MKTKSEQIYNQRGNALVYVLVAIALFAALTIALSGQTDTAESNSLEEETVNLRDARILSYSAQAKSAIDQLLFSGITIDELDFTLPDETGFDDANIQNNIVKVYHPDGAGLLLYTLPENIIDDSSGASPPPGVYIGRFNNVDWSPSAAQDVVLMAYQIQESLCESLNEKALGEPVIPELSGGRTIKSLFIDANTDNFGGGTNADFITDPDDASVCIECFQQASLCVTDSTGAYGFYSYLALQ